MLNYIIESIIILLLVLVKMALTLGGSCVIFLGIVAAVATAIKSIKKN